MDGRSCSPTLSSARQCTHPSLVDGVSPYRRVAFLIPDTWSSSLRCCCIGNAGVRTRTFFRQYTRRYAPSSSISIAYMVTPAAEIVVHYAMLTKGAHTQRRNLSRSISLSDRAASATDVAAAERGGGARCFGLVSISKVIATGQRCSRIVYL